MADKHLAELQAVIASTSALLSHLSSSLKDSSSQQNTSTTSPSSIPAAFDSSNGSNGSNGSKNSSKPPPNALALSSTAASLIKAQTTKLSLLVINKPFTPSAICTILKTLASECIPALITSVQLAGPVTPGPSTTPSDTTTDTTNTSSPPSSSFTTTFIYPRLIHSLLKQDASTILREFDSLLREIPTDERGISTAQNRGRDALASTGVIWAACDSIVALGESGPRTAAAQKASEAQDLIKDAISELTEWLEAEPDSDSDLSPSHSDAEDTGSSKSDSILSLLGGGGNSLSTCPARLRPTAQTALKLANHVRLLYPPITKRRLRKFPELVAKSKAGTVESGQAERLDTCVEALARVSTELDEVAGLLYEGQEEEVVSVQMRELVEVARECVKAVERDWEGNEDELTKWFSEKWCVVLAEIVEEIGG